MKYALPVVLVVFTSGGLQAVAQESTDFFPLRVGHQWFYRVVHVKDGQAKAEPGNVPFEKTIVTAERIEELPRKELDKENKIVEVQDASKKPVILRTMRLKVESGQKILYENVAVLAEGAYRFKAADKEIVPPLLFFKFDLGTTKTWRISCQSEGKKVEGTFTGAAAKVKTPSGERDGIHIASKDLTFGEQRMELEYWFAGGFGMVRQRVKLGGSEFFLELEKFVPGK